MPRNATSDDIPRLLPLVKAFADEIGFGEDYSHKCAAQTLSDAISTGVVLVEEKDDELVGLIVGSIARSPWNPFKLMIEELMFYVNEDYRNTRAGYMLLKTYTDRVSDMDLYASSLKLMYNSPDLTKVYEKLGYKLLEKTFVKKF